MRPFKLLPLLALTSSMLWYVPPSTRACEKGPSTALAPDEMQDGVTRGGHVCDTPAPCDGPLHQHQPPNCPAIDPQDDPFDRTQGPVAVPNQGTLCFAVARKDNGEQYLFDTGSGHHRYQAMLNNGVLSWIQLSDYNFTYNDTVNDWFNEGIQCPDPHFIGSDFTGTGQMWMYFITGAGPDHYIGRAVSTTNNGRVWNVDDNFIEDFTDEYKPNQPSVIKIAGGYLMAYTLMCKPTPTSTIWDSSTIEFLFSTNGGTGWVTRVNQQNYETGGCGRFDDGTVNRARLVRDASYGQNENETIHMFYSAYEWGGSVPIRNCGRIGHAISYDDGLHWQRAGAVFEPSSGQAWDTISVLKPSLVVEPCPSGGSIIRLFYEGGGSTGFDGSLGIAEAPWPFDSTNDCLTGTMIALNEQTSPDDEGSMARLTSVPNPTRGTTTIEVDFSRAQVAGEAELTIIDVTGRLVRHLWTGSSLSAPSSIDWDGRESSGARVAPGKYLARMRLGDMTAGTHWITMTR